MTASFACMFHSTSDSFVGGGDTRRSLIVVVGARPARRRSCFLSMFRACLLLYSVEATNAGTIGKERFDWA